jgi:hypothetical protein
VLHWFLRSTPPTATLTAIAADASASFNSSAIVDISLHASSHISSALFDISNSFGISLNASAQPSSSRLNFIQSLIARPSFYAQRSSASFGAFEGTDVLLRAASHQASADFSASWRSNASAILRASSQPATARFNILESYQANILASAQPSTAQFNLAQLLSGSLNASASHASALFGGSQNLSIDLLALASSASAHFLSSSLYTASLSASAQPSTAYLAGSESLLAVLMASAGHASASLTAQGGGVVAELGAKSGNSSASFAASAVSTNTAALYASSQISTAQFDAAGTLGAILTAIAGGLGLSPYFTQVYFAPVYFTPNYFPDQFEAGYQAAQFNVITIVSSTASLKASSQSASASFNADQTLDIMLAAAASRASASFSVPQSNPASLSASSQPASGAFSALVTKGTYTAVLNAIAQPSIGAFTTGVPFIYSRILLSVQYAIQQTLTIAANNQIIITLHPEPFPTWGGPGIFIMPGSMKQIESQVDGAGRYFSGFEGFFKIRVVDRSLKDVAYSETLKYTSTDSNSQGILRTCMEVINRIHIQFPYDFTLSGGSPVFNNSILSEEPIVMMTERIAGNYKKSSQWGIVDLDFRVRWYQPFSVTNTPDITIPGLTTIPTVPNPTNMADLLLSIQQTILKYGGFQPTQPTIPQTSPYVTTDQVMISKQGEVFPKLTGPFCVISPDDNFQIEPDTYGAARSYASIDSGFTVNVIIRNIMDQAGLSTNLLTNQSALLGLYARVQYVLEALQLRLLADLDGNLISENPVHILGIGQPKYYGKDSDFAGVPMKFGVRYQLDISPPP